MNMVAFTYSAKFGHFLRAEANANGITYPVPPRTALLGLVGAILGLEKDSPQSLLKDAQLAIGGVLPKRFWHKTNVRKDPPAPLSQTVKATEKGSSSEQRNFRFPQEWLWKPNFRVWAALPEEFHSIFVTRLQERRWHYGPCMGLSEMLADVNEIVEGTAERLPTHIHWIQSLAPKDVVEVDLAAASEQQLTLQLLRMPVGATADRVFQHRAYWIEHRGRAFPAKTAQAWQIGSNIVVFL